MRSCCFFFLGVGCFGPTASRLLDSLRFCCRSRAPDLHLSADGLAANLWSASESRCTQEPTRTLLIPCDRTRHWRLLTRFEPMKPGRMDELIVLMHATDAGKK